MGLGLAVSDPADNVLKRAADLNLTEDDLRLHVLPFLAGYTPEGVAMALDSLERIRGLISQEKAAIKAAKARAKAAFVADPGAL